VNKTATSVAQLAKCILLHAYSLLFPSARAQTKTSYRLLTSWHNKTFG